MKGKRTLCLALLVLAACDEKPAPTGTMSPHIAGKNGGSNPERTSTGGEEKVPLGKTKSNERRKEAARKAPTAEPARGEPGKVISPFSGKLVDVAGKAPGEQVHDPAFPEDESKMFVVPEDVEVRMPVARAVPGKADFVFSPHNNRIVDVTGMPPGTLVADPAYPAAEKKYFRIPEGTAPPEDGGAH